MVPCERGQTTVAQWRLPICDVSRGDTPSLDTLATATVGCDRDDATCKEIDTSLKYGRAATAGRRLTVDNDLSVVWNFVGGSPGRTRAGTLRHL